MPKASHSLYDQFRMLRIQSSGQDYAEQKELLDRLHETRGDDVSVASYSVVQHKDTGHRIGYCEWTKGTISLLPQAEWIVLGGGDRKRVMVSWDKVAEIVGDLMTPMGMYPERYRVEGFPTADQLAAMGNEVKGS